MFRKRRRQQVGVTPGGGPYSVAGRTLSENRSQLGLSS